MSLPLLYWPTVCALWPDRYWVLELAVGCWPTSQLGSSTNEADEASTYPSAWTVNIFPPDWYGFVRSIINNTVLSGLIIHVLMAAHYVCFCLQIRRRRPTPATLFRVADQSSPEDDQSTHQVKVKSKQFSNNNTCLICPPSVLVHPWNEKNHPRGTICLSKTQPTCRNKCWQCTHLQTMDMLKLYVTFMKI